MSSCVAVAGAARWWRAARASRRSILERIALFAVSVPLAAICFSPAIGRLRAAEPTGKASTARADRDEVYRAIPLKRMSAEARAKVSAVIDDASLYRRLPIETVDCDPELFRFIINNPDVLVGIWRVLGVTSVSLDRADMDHFKCSDGDGTTARVEVVYRSAQMQVIYAEGFYDGPLFPKPVRGQCVCVLQYVSGRKSSGRFEENVRLDTFLRVDNVGIEFLAKLFQGLVGHTIDHNFSETVGFVGSVSRTSEVNPRAMRRLAARLDQVEPQRRDQFAAIIERVSQQVVEVKPPTEDDEHSALAEVVRWSTVDEPPMVKSSKR